MRDRGIIISGSSWSLAKDYLQRADVGCGVGGSVYRVLCCARVLLLGRGQERVHNGRQAVFRTWAWEDGERWARTEKAETSLRSGIS